MTDHRWRRIAWLVAVLAIVAILLSLLWGVPYIYTLIGAATWTVAGQLITADDDLPGGWSNPDGAQPFPWRELGAKVAVVVVLVAVAAYFPVVTTFGSR